MQHEKSILSQITLDTSKIYNSETILHRGIPPIHAGESSYIFYKHKTNTKIHPKPLPFGTTSSRIIQQIEGKPSSHISGYQPVYKNYEAEWEECSRIAPFGSSQDRFRDKSDCSPGPAKYNTDTFEMTKHKSANTLFPTVGRQEHNKYDDSLLGPGAYTINSTQISNRDQLRQKIREKYKVTKKKYMETLIKHNKEQLEAKKSMNMVSENDQKLIRQSEADRNDREEKLLHRLKGDHDINRFVLKENTEKYLPKAYSGHPYSSIDPICSINKNFMSIFIEKKDDAYHSYIPKTEQSPGPGYYQRRQPDPTYTQSCSFKSKAQRHLFEASSDKPSKKEKIKLSHLL